MKLQWLTLDYNSNLVSFKTELIQLTTHKTTTEDFTKLQLLRGNVQLQNPNIVLISQVESTQQKLLNEISAEANKLSLHNTELEKLKWAITGDYKMIRGALDGLELS